MYAPRTTRSVRAFSLSSKVIACAPLVEKHAMPQTLSKTSFFTERSSISLGSCVLPVFCGWDDLRDRPIFAISHIFHAEEKKSTGSGQNASPHIKPARAIIQNVFDAYLLLNVPKHRIRCLLLAGGAANGFFPEKNQWEQNIAVTKQVLIQHKKTPMYERTGEMIYVRLLYIDPTLTILCRNTLAGEEERFTVNVRALFRTHEKASEPV